MLHGAELPNESIYLNLFSSLCVFYASRETPLINRFYRGLCILAANCQVQFFVA